MGLLMRRQSGSGGRSNPRSRVHLPSNFETGRRGVSWEGIPGSLHTRSATTSCAVMEAKVAFEVPFYFAE
jgi:hypothetical protein